MARHKCYSIPLIRRQVPIKVPSPATLMMTERGVNTLHYASSLSGVTRSGEFRRADLSPRDGFIWIRINNSLSNLKENNDQNRDFSALQRTFYFAWQEIGLKLNLEISMAKKIFTKQMSVHCLLVSEVSRERRGVQLWLEALLPTKQFNCSAQIGYLSQSSK